jgi:hypothetical protein
MEHVIGQIQPVAAVFAHFQLEYKSACTVPRFPNGLTSGVDLVAGFLAVEQDPEDLAISPVIGWSVTESAPIKPVQI